MSDLFLNAKPIGDRGANQWTSVPREYQHTNTISYLVGRLLRDAPATVARIDDFATIHEAAIHAGILKRRIRRRKAGVPG